MVDDNKQTKPSLETSKKRFEKALERLESAIDDKVTDASEAIKEDAALIAAREEIYELHQQNKIVSSRLDKVINQIKRILGNPGY